MSAKNREPLYQSFDNSYTKNTFPGHPCIQSDFDNYFHYRRPDKKRIKDYIKEKKWRPKETFLSLFPILSWLPNYNWRTDLFKDFVAGLTVAIMHIPQGMAYSMLANVEPVVGIYMAFFPVLIYVFLGTSKHLSMGTFAVICMMTSKSVFLYASDSQNQITNSTNEDLTENNSPITYSPIQVATAVCFLVGMWQLILGICRLGSLSVILSNTLISSFTTGAACHVITSQVKSLFDIKVKRFTGPLKVIYTYIDLFNNIHNTNYVALGISAASITFLAVYNQHLKNRIEKFLPIPLSIELVAVILGTVLSYFFGWHENYNLTVVGNVPVGFPKPFIPPYALFFSLLLDSLIIAIVSFSVNISLATMFATKLKYGINPNQELIASGCANIFGSFFSCLPFAASLSRSLIQQTVGGVTQIASLISCSLLLFVLLFIGPYFGPLPNCILASIVVVALKGMFMQVLDLPGIWRKSTFDGILWVSTFAAVILLDIDYGLAFGVIISLISLIMRGQTPRVFTLGQIPDINIFVDMKRYEKAVEIPGIIIIQISGGLHFANKDILKKKIFKIINEHISDNQKSSNLQQEDDIENKNMLDSPKQKIISVVLDMVSITYVDPSVIQTFINIYKELQSMNIFLCLADCPGTVFERMIHCDFFYEFPDNQTFITVRDAVLFSKMKKDQQIAT